MENNTDEKLDVILNLYRQTLVRWVEQSEFENLKKNPVFKTVDEFNSADKYLRTENYINDQGITPKGEKFVGFVEASRLEKQLAKDRAIELENSNQSIVLTLKNISLTKWTILISACALIVAIIALMGQFDIIGNKDKTIKQDIEQNNEVKASTSNTIQADTEKTQPTDTIIELKVKLIENVEPLKKSLADCGILKIEMAFKYQVIEVITGPYDKKEISINHVCPLMSIKNKWLETGKVYTYKLKRYYKVFVYTVGQKSKPVATDEYEII